MNKQVNRVYCRTCKEDKNLQEPFYILKKKGKQKDIISLRGLCPNCNRMQSKTLTQNLMSFEGSNVFESYPYGEYNIDSNGNIQDKEGGILPLLPLLGVIFGGITAAAGVSTAVAVPVQNKLKADEEAKAQQLALEEQKRKNDADIEEERRKNDELIKIAKEKSTSDEKTDFALGHGLNSNKTEKLINKIKIALEDHDLLKNMVKDILKDEIEKSFNLLPKLMERPEMQRLISKSVSKFNILGHGLSDDENLNEQKQIAEAIEFLEGKGFNFLI
jgi:hypothetical protein